MWRYGNTRRSGSRAGHHKKEVPLPPDGGHHDLVSVQNEGVRRCSNQRLHTIMGFWQGFLCTYSQFFPKCIRLQITQVGLGEIIISIQWRFFLQMKALTFVKIIRCCCLFQGWWQVFLVQFTFYSTICILFKRSMLGLSRLIRSISFSTDSSGM